MDKKYLVFIFFIIFAVIINKKTPIRSRIYNLSLLRDKSTSIWLLAKCTSNTTYIKTQITKQMQNVFLIFFIKKQKIHEVLIL